MSPYLLPIPSLVIEAFAILRAARSYSRAVWHQRS